MKIFDMHIHNRRGVPDPERLLQEMAEGGVWGGCVFSDRPFETNPKIGVAFEQRLEEILAWTNGYEDRLFPVLWIHPREKDIAKKIRIAAEQGICAFKLTCPDYYVYEKAAQDCSIFSLWHYHRVCLRRLASKSNPQILYSTIILTK